MTKANGKGKAEKLAIAPRLKDKAPLKVSVYEHAQSATGSLTPMFPFRDEGSMVPCATLLWGKKNGEYGFLMHDNCVDEVVVMFGGQNTTGRADTGVVRVAPNRHGVGHHLKDCEEPEAFSLICLTVRQRQNEEQKESVWFVCEECKAEMTRIDYDATPPKHSRQREHGICIPLDALIGCAEMAEIFNDSEASRTCPECGHVNPPFPEERWGWEKYAGQTLAVQSRARLSMRPPTRPSAPQKPPRPPESPTLRPAAPSELRALVLSSPSNDRRRQEAVGPPTTA